MTNTVVVGVDGTGRSLTALMWAAHRAALHGVPLRVVHGLPRYEGDVPLFPPGRFEEAQDHGREIIEEATSLVREAYTDMDIVTEMPMGTPARVLLAEAENAHVVVIGAKGEDIGNFPLGSTALQLVGHAACPVVVVNHVTTGHHLVVAGDRRVPRVHRGARLRVRCVRPPQSASAGDQRARSPAGLADAHLLRPLPEDNEEVAKRVGGTTCVLQGYGLGFWGWSRPWWRASSSTRSSRSWCRSGLVEAGRANSGEFRIS